MPRHFSRLAWLAASARCFCCSPPAGCDSGDDDGEADPPEAEGLTCAESEQSVATTMYHGRSGQRAFSFPCDAPVQTKLLHASGDARTFAVVFDTGDDPADGLRAFAEEHDISAAHLTGLGAFREATLGFYVPETQAYEEIPVRDQVEVLSLTGNVARYDGAPKLHAHAVLGRRGGGTVGGHLLEAAVRPTLEVMLTEMPATLQREMDDASGLPLLSLRE